MPQTAPVTGAGKRTALLPGGRVLLAPATDPEADARSGSTVITAEAAVEYAITDIDGGQPVSHRAAFGGGALLGVRRDRSL